MRKVGSTEARAKAWMKAHDALRRYNRSCTSFYWDAYVAAKHDASMLEKQRPACGKSAPLRDGSNLVCSLERGHKHGCLDESMDPPCIFEPEE